jgi:NitT/TauT family transport system substrate-binding protein
LAAAATVAALLAVAACSGEDDDNGGDNGDEPDQVTYVTAFGAVGRDAFAWVAQERGIFEANGLEVDIQPGAGTGPNLQALEAGQADFTAMDMTGATIEAGNGNHTDFRVIAAIHQSTLVAIISLEGYGVTAPQDLAGKQLGAATASVNQLLFPAYAAEAGIDESQVEWVNADPPNLPGLLAAGEVDALSTFLIGARGIEVAAEGTPSVVLPYSEYLPDLFGNGIMTSASLVEDDPDLVQRFRDAMLEALEWTVDNPEEAAQILNQANPDSAVEAAVGEITAMTDAVRSAGTIGVVDQARVANAISLLEQWELMPPGLTPEAVVAFDQTPQS